MIYHVTCSTDDNYLQHCVAMLCSLYENNRNSHFCLHLLVNSLSQDGRNIISELGKRYDNETIVHEIDESLVENLSMNTWAVFNGKNMYSIATYYRIFLPSILPEIVDKILYLDCDVIVLDDVSELYHLNMEGYGIAAVKDASPFDSYHRNKMGLGLQHSAFCAGVMMINLAYWRENKCQEKLLEYSSRKWDNAYLQDQDALNYVFRDRWLVLPYKWGKTPCSIVPFDNDQKSYDCYEYAYKPSIIHYSSHTKPWFNIWFEERKYYWHYLKVSDYQNPKITKLLLKNRIKLSLTVFRYLINRYVRPIVPNFIEIIIKDVYGLVLLFFSMPFSRKRKTIMLNRWLSRY